jgi:hypothetical protein
MMNRTKYLSLLIFLYATTCLAQIDHWESVVVPGENWKYQVFNSQPETSWIQSGFDDSAWPAGNSGIGYGDDDDATIIAPTLSLHMRKQFYIFSPDEVEGVFLDMDFDDGFVAYLNGVEIARSLVSGEFPGYDQPADGLHEALLYNGADPERFEVDKNLLNQGNNILAIEVHNDNIGSSDMTSIPTLSLGINTTNYNYTPVPDWFDTPVVTQEVVLESSNLPIVLINTAGGLGIPNEPKIVAKMTIIDNGSGLRNLVTDASNPASLDYDGNIQIEIRGSSSACCSPKKQYALTTYDALGAKENVSLFGLPKENDWILNAFAFDPSLMRDYISYQLSLKMGQYASRGVYCEVILNGDYQGVYVMQEKLKADDNRIDINKIGETDNTGDALTGGYITKSDKTEGSDVAAWSMDNYAGWQTAFVHEHPKPEAVTPQQDEYIRNQFFKLEAAAGNHNNSLINGYPSIIDLPSFIDFIIINELASNADAYQFSTFFHKDRNAKLRAGPVWDLNLTYGNDLFFWGFDRSHTDLWQFDDNENVGAKFWKDLFDDATFKCYFRKRWNELSQPGQALHPDQINILIDDVTAKISEATERDYTRWGIIGDHASHIAAMKQWVVERVNWISAQLGTDAGCTGDIVPELVLTKIQYHPMTADGTGEKDLEFIEITNIGTETADLTGVYFGGTGLVYQFPSNANLPSGSSVYLASESLTFTEAYGFAPYDEFNRSLNNGGQRIELLNGFGNLIDEVTYSDEAPWPVEADGEGYFLELIDPNVDNQDPANWKASQVPQMVLASGTLTPVIKMYPNPAIDFLTLSVESRILLVKIWDMNGRMRMETRPDKSTIVFDVHNLADGLYLVEIQSVNGRYLRKMMIGK